MLHCRRTLLVFLCSLSLLACGGGSSGPTSIPTPTVQDSDNDNDGINDGVDSCPNTLAGVEVDAQGCEIQTEPTDSDNDGVADDLDSCPNTPAGAEVDAQGCEIQTEPTDSDNDGVADDLDSCPNTSAGAEVDAQGCEIQTEPADSDNDGVADDLDSCPNTPAGAAVDAQGCETQTGGTVSIQLQAEDYTNYSDTTAGNTGGAYKTDDVDIEVTTDDGGGYNVGYIEASEFLEYSLDLPAGIYGLSARVASAVGGGNYSLSLNGQVVAAVSVPATGGWQTFITQSVGSVQLAAASYTLRVDAIAGNFNLNWLLIETVLDDDVDGVTDQNDICPATSAGTSVNDVGCPDSDGDGVYDNEDSCPDTDSDVFVDAEGCELVQPLIEVAYANDILVAGADASNPGFTLYVFDNDLDTTGSSCNDGCASNWPPLLATDGSATGVPDLSLITRNDGSLQVAYLGRPLYYFINDTAVGQTNGTAISGWHTQEFGNFGDITPLYSVNTQLERSTLFETTDAVVTMFADRGRDRHAKEDQFQQYDHYLSHYWTHRTARFKFTDYVAKGGSRILVEFVTEWQLEALEFRAWYSGRNTVAEYHGNYEHNVVTEGHGTYDDDLKQISTEGDQYKYSLEINENRGLDGSVNALAIGQHMEVEVSQFLLGVPEGRSNYYGTTYLYQVGVGGMVPWKTVGDFADKSSERENSHPIEQSAWLGGKTTLPYQYTNEPDDHFLQMSTNLSSLNGQAFVLGRRIHHTSFVNGEHDESPDNGFFDEMIDKAGPHYVNHSCAACHVRNGRAAPAPVGDVLDKWVFKIADIDGNPDAQKGRILQPLNTGNGASEGSVVIESWTEVNGLRSPNYQFTEGRPAKFSGRIAPQLVGLGLLEAIPEETILALQDPNDEVEPIGISGRAQKAVDPVTLETRLGRFGWKAATSSLKHQIAAAFNTDIGVMTSVLPNPDCGEMQAANNECGAAGMELEDEHLDNLVKYVALLGVRAQRNSDDPNVIQGKQLFTDIGCADCHVETLQTSIYHPFTELRDQTIHPYTDLLLHDMGEGLADNLGEGEATGAEWRTTPLWGIGLSACVTGGVINPIGGQGNEVCSPVHSYLHDGRARTINEAILWHGGESASSTTSYQNLTEEDKAKLLAFINSL